jgi:hypothetical protein
MKTRSKNPLITGIMWLDEDKNIDMIRHSCEMEESLKYGWRRHNGENFGRQEIEEKDYIIKTDFIKVPHKGEKGGDWTGKETK